MQQGEDLCIKCRIQGRWNSRLARREKSGKISGYYSGSGKTPKTPEKSKKWSSSESFPKILKNNKYYKKIFGEIGFQKFNLIFKIKIIKSTVNIGLHRVGRILIKSVNSQKKYLDRKYNFKKLWESRFLKFNSVCKLKIREPVSGTGRPRFWRFTT